MTEEALVKLIDRYLAGEATPEEETVLNAYFERFQDSHEWDEQLLGSELLVEQKLASKIAAAVSKRTHKREVSDFGVSPIWRRLAATVMIALTIGGLFNHYYSSELSSASLVAERKVDGDDLVPGADIASLTLQDGSVINLNDSVQKEIALGDGSVIQKKENGQLIYNLAKASAGNQVTYNVLSIPKGGQYQVVLSDGTKVWLNSETSLRFPTVFVGNERKVELTGEAYFDIAKDKSKEFKVLVKGMEVTALGTEFNVNAYEGNEVISATLFEGSVRVKKEEEHILLIPGQQAQLDKAKGTFQRGEADLEAEIAWKEGYFVFNNEDIKSIMVKLSRWYDADIEYRGDIANKRFTVIISRRSSISEILEILESTGTIHFKIEGRRVIVMA